MPISGYFDTPFAIDGSLTAVPDAAQGDGSVSYNQGFGILYSTAVDSGGKNFPRAQHNQILNDVTTAIQVIQQGLPAAFITSAMNNGSPFPYALGARVVLNGVTYQSAINNNTDTPPTANWIIPRQRLTANANFYVSTAGSDTNAGTSGSPWLTIQHAINYIAGNIDLAGFNIIVNVADGTYTTPVVVAYPFTGSGTVTLTGDTANPNNCIMQVTNANCVTVFNGAALGIGGFLLETITSGHGIQSVGGGAIAEITGQMQFGTISSTDNHLQANDGGQIILNSSYKIVGSATSHFSAQNSGKIGTLGNSLTITLTGSPNFTYFANATVLSMINAPSITFSGTATGPKFSASGNSVINSSGGGINYFPGNSAGVEATGGQYLS